MATALRSSPDVLRFQAVSPYIHVYGLPTFGSANKNDSPTHPKAHSKSDQAYQHLPSVSPPDLLSHAHPESLKWINPEGYGSRHVHDKAPFSLWNESDRRFHSPTSNQRAWIIANFSVRGMGWMLHFMYIETDQPPEPVPLTLGCMPVLFVGIGEVPKTPAPSAGYYANPRVKDPCPQISWPKLSNPKKLQKMAVLTCLTETVNPKAIYFLPSMMVVELALNDGRSYEPHSLPGIVAGRTTLYHHSETPFLNSMKDLHRERRLDPAKWEFPETGPLPQDCTNYLLEPPSLLTPGVRLSSGRGAKGTSYENTTQATSAGVRLRNSSTGQDVVTVAYHGFRFSNEVYHPTEEDGVRIGDVIDSRPELDVAFMKLTPSESHKFTNSVYFQAEQPTRLVSEDEIAQGSWSEVDGMSSGLVSLLSEGTALFKPERPPGHPDIPFSRWRSNILAQVFGAVNNRMVDGMCGAPIVGCDTGHVQGFFHLGSGYYSRCATLDDLITEGWAMV
ncbi:hypothetical protein MMC31_006200 [Peltigera leucophlebia]|nr:hypothetical protein [Peltigera leucophlebia]